MKAVSGAFNLTGNCWFEAAGSKEASCCCFPEFLRLRAFPQIIITESPAFADLMAMKCCCFIWTECKEYLQLLDF